ncbi:winged helix-turn-helix domain-containing protein [Nocardia sp. CC216A]|uniref:winged helix-turn-helix domain-containing protein n=1 Tax=unclassified Nocardia TaxID=2637762 RepID=UPI003558A1D9
MPAPAGHGGHRRHRHGGGEGEQRGRSDDIGGLGGQRRTPPPGIGEHLLRRPPGPLPAILVAGDLVLDPARHRCRRGDREVVLTARQFALLECLMRRAGEVVSKTEILDQVWDSNYRGDDNIVEVYARRLRRKVDLPFGRSAIETLRRVGYRCHPYGG